MTAIKGNLQFKGTFRHLPPLYTILQVATIQFSSFHTQNILFFFNNGNEYALILFISTFPSQFANSTKSVEAILTVSRFSGLLRLWEGGWWSLSGSGSGARDGISRPYARHPPSSKASLTPRQRKTRAQ